MTPHPVLPLTFSPLQLNRLPLANRVLLSSMHLNFEGPEQYERLAHFYQVRAADGPGVIVTAGCSPDLRGCAITDGFSIHDDETLEGHCRIVDAVRARGGSRLALQLLHFGREAFHGRLVAPSAIRLEGNLFTPRAMEHAEIIELIGVYASAARRAVQAGYDAVELVFSQGFLIHQFLSPHTNRRTDEWGGSLQRRMRLAVEVAAAVRAAVGPDYPLIFRVPCLDMIEGGLGFEDACALVRAIEPSGIDLLNVSIGWHESNVPTIAAVVPPSGYAALALRVKRAFPHLPTCVSNRINDPRHVEELLADGVADMVAMGRPFLADSALMSKAAQGDFDAIQRCIACNQDCLDNVFQGKVVGCSVNPDCSRPDEGAPPEPLPSPLRVAVVGGGVAGMACAQRLAMRGARVTLYEQSRELGGQLALAARIPGKDEFGALVRSFSRNLERLGVEVVLGREFGVAQLDERRWDRLVLAIGTVPNAWDRPPGCQARVLDFRDLLGQGLPVAYPLLVLGGGGVAIDVAKYLASRESRIDASDKWLRKQGVEALVGALGPVPVSPREITIVQRSSKKLGYKLGRTTRWIAIDELKRAGVHCERGARLSGFDGLDAILTRHDGSELRRPARTIVVCLGQHARPMELRQAARSRGIVVDEIGASIASTQQPASISSSIRSAFDCANAVGQDSTEAAR